MNTDRELYPRPPIPVQQGSEGRSKVKETEFVKAGLCAQITRLGAAKQKGPVRCAQVVIGLLVSSR